MNCTNCMVLPQKDITSNFYKPYFSNIRSLLLVKNQIWLNVTKEVDKAYFK